MADKENKQTGSESANTPKEPLKTTPEDSQEYQEEQTHESSAQPVVVHPEQEQPEDEEGTPEESVDPAIVVDGVTYDRFGNQQASEETDNPFMPEDVEELDEGQSDYTVLTQNLQTREFQQPSSSRDGTDARHSEQGSNEKPEDKLDESPFITRTESSILDIETEDVRQATDRVPGAFSESDNEQPEEAVMTTVTRVNEIPVARQDSGTGDENETFFIDVLANDTDANTDDGPANFTLDRVAIVSVDGDVLTGRGQASIVNNQLQFIPGEDFEALAAGEDATVVVRYTMSDRFGGTSESTVTLTITGSNDAPFVSQAISSEAGADDASYTIDLLSHAGDVDVSDTLSVQDGSVQLVSGDGSGIRVMGNQMTVDPSAYAYLENNEEAVIEYRFTVEDDKGGTVEQVATITMTGTNDIPVAAADVGSASENQALMLDVLANDTDADAGDTYETLNLDSATIVDSNGDPLAGQGSVTIASRQVRFDPGTDFDYLASGETATVTVRYEISDRSGATSEATATITVTGTNDDPVATADTATGHENQTLTIDVLANDTDVDHNNAPSNFSLDSVQIVDGDGNPLSGQGTVSVVNNQLQFVPGSDFDSLANGESTTVTVRYVMSDNEGAESTSTATITVTGTNDDPVASADTQTGHENQTLTIDVLANDTDVDHNDDTSNFSLDSVQIIDGDGNPLSGQGTVSVVNNQLQFVPGSDFDSLANGESTTVTVRYVMSDNEGATSESTATITVTGTNDDPVASADTQTGHENQTLTIDVLANDTDVDHNDDPSNFSLDSVQIIDGDGNTLSGQGTVSVVNNQLQFVPGSDFDSLANGESTTVTVRYVMSDNEGATSESTATITVTGTNDDPVASADTQTGHENQTLTIDVLANDTDVDHNDDPSNFSLDSVQIVDGDGNPLSGQGTVSVVNNQLQFVPGSDFDSLANGESTTVTVRYVMSDNEGAESTSTATITVTGTNDDPVASADTQTGHENQTLTIDVLANDTDVDHNDGSANFSLDSVQIVDGDGNPLNGQGTVSVVNNQLQFVPGSDFDSLANGESTTVTVRYVMSDNEGAESTSTATITVTGTNDDPVASADTATGHENQTLTINVLANDTDVDHNDDTSNFSLDSVQIIDGDGNPLSGQGTVSVVNNQLQFVPGSDFDSLANGESTTVTVRYVMSDNEGAESTSTATITVTGTNDDPVASADTQTGHENQTLTIDVLANDTDVDHNDDPSNFSLDSVQIIDGDGNTLSGQGTVSVVNNQLQFVPGSDFDSLANGESTTVTVRYVMSDNEGATSESTATITVTGTNDDPVASADTQTGHENQTLTIDVLANDTDVDHNDDPSNFSLDSVQIVDGDGNPLSGQGTVSVVNNQLQFVPGSDFDSLANGESTTVTVRYVMSDNEGAESTSTATITVTGTNDDPVASADTQTGHENQTLTIDVLANDTDVDHNDGSANFSLDSVQIVDGDGNPFKRSGYGQRGEQPAAVCTGQ